MIIAATTFAEVWNSSATLSQVCQRTGWPKTKASLKAYRLRREGVKLKKFYSPGTGRPSDPSRLDAVRKIAAAFLPKPCPGCEHLRDRIRHLQKRVDELQHKLARRNLQLLRLI